MLWLGRCDRYIFIVLLTSVFLLVAPVVVLAQSGNYGEGNYGEDLYGVESEDDDSSGSGSGSGSGSDSGSSSGGSSSGGGGGSADPSGEITIETINRSDIAVTLTGQLGEGSDLTLYTVFSDVDQTPNCDDSTSQYIVQTFTDRTYSSGDAFSLEVTGLVSGEEYYGVVCADAEAGTLQSSTFSSEEVQSQRRALQLRLIELLQLLLSLLIQAQQTQATPTAPLSVDAPIVPSACTVTTPFLTRDLYIGLTGQDVMTLQQFLIERGYLNTTATSYFGPATRAAVEAFQAQNGIAALGGVGPSTRAAIHAQVGTCSR